MTTTTLVKLKDPQAKADYLFDFGGQMAFDSDVIVGTPTVVPSPSGLTIESSPPITVVAGVDDDGNTVPTSAVRVWLSGGTAGVTYDLTCHVVTGGGRIWELTGKVRVEQR